MINCNNGRLKISGNIETILAETEVILVNVKKSLEDTMSEDDAKECFDFLINNAKMTEEERHHQNEEILKDEKKHNKRELIELLCELLEDE